MQRIPSIRIRLTVLWLMLAGLWITGVCAQTASDDLVERMRRLVADCQQRQQKLIAHGADTTGMGAFQARLEEYYRVLRSQETRSAAEEASNPWWMLLNLSMVYQTLQSSRIDGLCNFARVYYAQKGKQECPAFWAVLEQSYLYNMKRRYLSSALNTADEMSRIAEEAADTSLLTAVGYYYQAMVYAQMNEAQMAEQAIEHCVESGKTRAMHETNDMLYYNYESARTMQANMIASKGHYRQALRQMDEVCDHVKQRFQEVSTQYISALMAKADLLNNCGKPERSMEIIDSLEMLGQQLPPELKTYWDTLKGQLAIARRTLKKDSGASAALQDMDYNQLWQTVSDAISAMDHEKAIAAGRLWMERCEKEVQPNFSNYNIMLRQVLSSYAERDRYSEALSLLKQAEDFLRDRNTDDPLALRAVYSLYGQIYGGINDYQRAIDYYNRSKLMYEEMGDLTEEYTLLLYNLLMAYSSIHDLAYARLFGEELGEIINNVESVGNKDQQQAAALLRQTVTAVYMMMGYDEPTANRLAGIDGAVQETGGERAETVMSMATQVVRRFSQKDLAGVKESLAKMRETGMMGRMNASALAHFESMQVLCDVVDHDTAAIAHLEQLNGIIHRNIFNVFNTFADGERDAFWEQQALLLNNLNGMVACHFQTHRQPAVMAFDNALFAKNLLNTSTQLARSIDHQGRGLDGLEDHFRHCADIQTMLDEGEVAVEMIGYAKLVTTPSPDFVDCYAALVMRYGDATPQFVELCRQQDIANIWQNVIHTDTALIDRHYQIGNTELYDLVWRPIDALLHEGDRVYFSPMGMLNRINFSAMSNGHYRLGDVYELHQLSSTANIAPTKQQAFRGYQSAIVYGGIDYHASGSEMIMAAVPYGGRAGSRRDTTWIAMNSVRASRGAIEDLPGTLEETVAIADVLRRNQVNVRLLQGSEANEESFKAMHGQSPSIIHIATHGFMLNTFDDLRTHQTFLESVYEDRRKISLMQLSGLLMAGAYNVWNEGGTVPEDVEDGVLTAAEIARLDLSNTRLMVLSACETGLSMNTTADDFGLKRALKNAGVETLVMSLWEVPDDATSMLMTFFFNDLTQGVGTRRALQNAQNAVRRKYPQPSCWAGFVVID